MDSLHMPEPERRRRRPPVSCITCRKRKIKCDQQRPCGGCQRSKSATCVYRDVSPPARTHRGITKSRPTPKNDSTRHSADHIDLQINQAPSAPNTVRIAPKRQTVFIEANSSTRPGQSPTDEVQTLKTRIKELEEQISGTPRQSVGLTTPSPNYNNTTTTSHFAGTFHVHSESVGAGQAPTISRAIMHKTRVFGQSHWMNGVTQFAEILEIIEPFLQNEGLTVMSNLTKCKWLGKMIKAQRTPAWPCPPTTEFPPKKIADVLVANYLRMSESVYRVLHIPTFKRDYEAIMISNDPDMASVVLLKLIMAIGSTVYDDKFSMRATAIRWVHEAQTWISEPEFKARLGIQFLQIQILLLIARGIVGVEGTLVWVSTGQLIRFAIYMGLNRDPEILPKASCYSSEMRRRLWNTILELDLQASMESGGPPFNSLNEFNTLPPGNFDDEAITEQNPTPEPEDMFTQTSIALALRKTFPLRTHIAKMLNGMAVHAGYEETLRLDSELRASYKGICRQLQGYKTTSGRKKPSDFETRMLDFLIRRFLTALHMPFFGSSVKDAQYAYSRKVVIESSLKTWCTIFPSSSAMISLPGSSNTSSKSDDISRLALCGTGSFRMVSMQAAFLIAVELKTQVQEDPSPGPMSLRTDLYSVLQDGKRWSLRCIEAGETNIKGYLFMCLVCTQIESLMRGIPREELPLVILKSAEEAEADCLRILEGNIDAGTSDPYQSMKIPMDPLSEIMGDWSLMMPGTHFYLGDSGNMDWMTMDSLAAAAGFPADSI